MRLFALAALTPLIVTSALIIYVALRYRGSRPGEPAVFTGNEKLRTGVKTMPEVMGLLEAIPFRKRLPRSLATLALAAADFIPVLLNTNRATAGLVYPYPEEFEPVITESRDGTPICGLLAMQPGGDSRPAIIIAHGLFSSKNMHTIRAIGLRAYYDWGFHVLALDLRNFGDSSRFSDAPTSWGYRESDDILAVADYLESMDRVSTVGLYGANMGAASALLAAGRSRLDRSLSGGVVAINGYADAAREVEHISTLSSPTAEEFITWLTFSILLFLKTTLGGPRPLVDLREYTRQVSSQYYEVGEDELYRKASPVKAMMEIEVPCLVIHSRDDRVVPVLEEEELEAAAKDNPMVGFIVTPAGGPGLYQVISRKWFYKTLKTFFLYWGEYAAGTDPGQAGVDSMNMFGNPDN